MLFGHVVGFASQNAPQQDQDFKWVSASYFGSIWGSHPSSQLGHFMAMLVPSSGQLWLCWRLCGALQAKTTGKYSPKRSPSKPWRRDRQIKNRAGHNKKNRQNVNPHSTDGKTQPKATQKSPPKRSPQWPCSQNVSRANQKIGSSLAELYEMTLYRAFLARAVWADLLIFFECRFDSFHES